MISPGRRLRQRAGDFFCLDDDWDRGTTLTGRGIAVADVVTAGVVAALGAVSFELLRSMGAFEHVHAPLAVQVAAVLAGAALLVARRRYPLTVAVLAATHMFVVGVTMPQVMGQTSLQIVYFTAIASGVAWARSRRDMLVVATGVVLFMAAWLAWYFALGSAIDNLHAELGDAFDGRPGLVPPVTAAMCLSALVNLLYFGGAVVWGQLSWRSARQRARLAEQAQLLAAQGETLRRRAVVAERLRIARELHDVVAHHVSVMGVSAAAARRVLHRDPDAAATALGRIEQSSREAVTQLRDLLGTLRAPEDGEPAAEQPARRAPEPGLAELPALVEEACSTGLSATYRLVEDSPGAAASVPAALALSVYRIAAEALANVRRHSTASRVGVVVRVRPPEAGGPGWVEVEVVDDGRPRAGTSGTGLGQLGIRERAVSHRGEVEIGPRLNGGYRVRVRLPLPVVPARRPSTPVAVRGAGA